MILNLCHDLGPEFSESHTFSVLTKRCRRISFNLHLNTSEDTDTFIAASQIGRRQLRDEMEITTNARLPIKLQIYHKNSLLFNQNFKKMRNRNRRMILSPGNYQLCVEADYVDVDTQFFLRVAAHCSPSDIVGPQEIRSDSFSE